MTQKWTENSLLMKIKLNFRKVKKKKRSNVRPQMHHAGESGGGAGEERGSGGKVGVSLLNDRNISVAFAT